MNWASTKSAVAVKRCSVRSVQCIESCRARFLKDLELIADACVAAQEK